MAWLFRMGFADQLREVGDCSHVQMLQPPQQCAVAGWSLAIRCCCFQEPCRLPTQLPSVLSPPHQCRSWRRWAPPARPCFSSATDARHTHATKPMLSLLCHRRSADPGGGGPLPPNPAVLGHHARGTGRVCSRRTQGGPLSAAALLCILRWRCSWQWLQLQLAMVACCGWWSFVCSANVINYCSLVALWQDPELVRLDTDTKISPDLSLAFFTVR